MQSRIVLRIKRFVPELENQKGVVTNKQVGFMDITCEADGQNVITPKCGKKVAIKGDYFQDFLVDPTVESVTVVVPGRESVSRKQNGNGVSEKTREGYSDTKVWEPYRGDSKLGFLRFVGLGYVVHLERRQDDSVKVQITTSSIESLDGKPKLLRDTRYEGIIPMYRYRKMEKEEQVEEVKSKLCESELMVHKFAGDLAFAVVEAYSSLKQ